MDIYIDGLKKVGLPEYDAKVYFMLLKKGDLKATEISKLTNVPITKIYSVLNNLVKGGLCTRVPGKFKKFKALNPEIAFSNFSHELEEKKEHLTLLSESLESLYESEKSDTDSLDDYIEVFKDRKQIHEMYVSLVRKTKNELIGFAKPPYAHERKRQKMNTQENTEFEILRKGVVVKGLYELPSTKDMEFITNHIEECIKAGEKARIIEKNPLKMYISDKKYVLMALDNPKFSTSPFTMLLIKHTDLAMACSILFDHLWEKAMPFEEFKNKYKL